MRIWGFGFLSLEWFVVVINHSFGVVRYLRAFDFMGWNLVAGVMTGIVSAELVFHVEPFRSNNWFAVLGAVGVGLISGLVEVAVRRIAKSVKSSKP